MRIEIEMTADDILRVVQEKFPSLAEEGWDIKGRVYLTPTFVWDSAKIEVKNPDEKFLDEETDESED